MHIHLRGERLRAAVDGVDGAHAGQVGLRQGGELLVEFHILRFIVFGAEGTIRPSPSSPSVAEAVIERGQELQPGAAIVRVLRERFHDAGCALGNPHVAPRFTM